MGWPTTAPLAADRGHRRRRGSSPARGSGVGLLAVSVLRGTFDDAIPAILLAIEPWFLLGGFAYGGMVVHQRNRTPSDILSH